MTENISHGQKDTNIFHSEAFQKIFKFGFLVRKYTIWHHSSSTHTSNAFKAINNSIATYKDLNLAESNSGIFLSIGYCDDHCAMQPRFIKNNVD
jgi:hypothetical protein